MAYSYNQVKDLLSLDDLLWDNLEFARVTSTTSFGSALSVGIPPKSMGVENGCEVCEAGASQPTAAVETAPIWNLELQLEPAGALKKIWKLVLPRFDVPTPKLALNDPESIYLRALADRVCFPLPTLATSFHQTCCALGAKVWGDRQRVCSSKDRCVAADDSPWTCVFWLQ